MRALCGEGRDVSCSAVGKGSGREIGMDIGARGVMLVGALLMMSFMTFGTL